MTGVRIIVVEDDLGLRDDLAWLLASRGFEVAGAFSSAEDALEGLDTAQPPRIALVDLGLPGASGVELIRRLRLLVPSLDSVVLTAFGDDDHVFDALRGGAAGYLLKSATSDEIAESLQEVLQGGAPMSPTIARKVVRSFGVSAPSPLSKRETEVLELLVKGASYPEIGRALGIALGTVQEHIKNVYRKLEVASKAEAAVEAVRRNLLP